MSENDTETYEGDIEVPTIDTAIAGIRGVTFDVDGEICSLVEAGVRDHRAFVTLSPPSQNLADIILRHIAEGDGTFTLERVAAELNESRNEPT